MDVLILLVDPTSSLLSRQGWEIQEQWQRFHYRLGFLNSTLDPGFYLTLESSAIYFANCNPAEPRLESV